MRGFTLIELLLVIALVLLLGGVTTPFLSRFIVVNQYELAVDHVVGTIRKAQGYAMAGKSSGAWGICVHTSRIRLYQGTCASPSHAEDFDIPSTISISGLSDTTFSAGRGEPSQELTIAISANTAATTIILNRAGGMTIN